MFITKVIEELLAWVEESGFSEKLTIEMLSEKADIRAVISRKHLKMKQE